MAIPPYTTFYNPILQALTKLGGSASITELDQEVINSFTFTEEELTQTAKNGRTNLLKSRLAWARTDLKIYGVISNSQQGIWVLTPKGKEIKNVDTKEVIQFYRKLKKENPSELTKIKNNSSEEELDKPDLDDDNKIEPVVTWQDKLWNVLVNLKPDAFERLCQRLLRENGFEKVEVTGKTGDGGIDGKGIININGLISFPIIFQCKRYQGSVGSKVVRDFRGAMVGRADRGLIITTGSFTADAYKEALRDGAPPIDLVDGTQLMNKLKELKLGVKVEMIEVVSVDPEWFENI
jgi:restriction system protein